MIVQLKKDYSSDHAFFITPPAVDETKQKYRNNKLIKKYISVLTEVPKRHDCEVSIFIRNFLNKWIRRIFIMG
ncbi:esterase [Enterococcus faecium]|uniref:esterase n=1 Tax=Enterococcus TaxID=1350 RepID=UPI000CF118E4|nr:esterase [Enterococcus faecium]EGP4918628.1 esterase [Enterococcus faecium]EME8163833.1 esterase [Enterococcus faecium]MBD9740343.1 esterase [Enterococcus faecium]MBD9743272.1 esterase [Enterococcus faecium]MBD9755229.1 esterase [Enterococcus faecium]